MSITKFICKQQVILTVHHSVHCSNFHGGIVQISVFWMVTACDLANDCRGFGGASCLHLQGWGEWDEDMTRICRNHDTESSHSEAQKGERKYSSNLELWETSLPFQEEETFNHLAFLQGINERLPGSTQGETSFSHSCDQILASNFLDLGNVLWGKSSVPWEQLQYEAGLSWSWVQFNKEDHLHNTLVNCPCLP